MVGRFLCFHFSLEFHNDTEEIINLFTARKSVKTYVKKKKKKSASLKLFKKVDTECVFHNQVVCWFYNSAASDMT